MTLREALIAANRAEVYTFINKKDNSSSFEKKKISMKKTKELYENVILELLSKPKTRKYSMTWLVQETTDSFINATKPYTKETYIDVCFLNPRYIAPDETLKPWGGKNPPTGYYNCNLNKHNKLFATGFTPWSKVIDTPIIITVPNCSLENAVAEILWEMTFYAWTEETLKVNVDSLVNKIKKVKEEIKTGRAITIPPKTKEGMSVVIPNSVLKELKSFPSKKKI